MLNHPTGRVPERVAIVAGGPSSWEFFKLCNTTTGIDAFADEVWAVNTMMRATRHDVGWMIDDPELFGYGAPTADFYGWLRQHDRPVICSRADPAFPCMTEYPLVEVLNELKVDYFEKSSPPYLIAYAIALGVKMISLWGVDYEIEDGMRPTKREGGRACVEFWTGVAYGRGIHVMTPTNTPLLGRVLPYAERFYGYRELPKRLVEPIVTARSLDDCTGLQPSAERQVTDDLAAVQADHIGRYKFAIEALKQVSGNARVLDCACGVGYGSWMLAEAGHAVVAVDKCNAAIDYAREHWAHRNVHHVQADALEVEGEYDAVISFETLEHLPDAPPVVERFAKCAPNLIFSVPNEKVVPWEAWMKPRHYRHYTPEQIAELAGPFQVTSEWGQDASDSEEIRPGFEGARTLIATAKRAA